MNVCKWNREPILELETGGLVNVIYIEAFAGMTLREQVKAMHAVSRPDRVT